MRYPKMNDLAAQINAEHERALSAVRTSLTHAKNAGELLIRAKQQCGHGKWLPWLAANVRVSIRVAQNYMSVAERWTELEANPQRVADLPYREGR